jgi:hypothetical protein
VSLARAKASGRDGIIGLERSLFDRAKAWAAVNGYTYKSVIETAVEEFLERRAGGAAGDDVDQVDDEPRNMLPVSTSTTPATVSAMSAGAIVVVRLEGRGPERLAEVLEAKASGNYKCKVQTFGGGKQKWSEQVIPRGDIQRAAGEAEISRWRSIAGAAVRGAA